MCMMRVFLSSTYIDLVEYRKAAADALQRLGQQVGQMEVFGARPEEPATACLKEIEECALFVGIYAHRYGFIPAGESVSITEAEFRHAQKHRKPSFCFLIDENYPWLPKMIEGEPGRSYLISLKNAISTSVVRDTFTTPDDLALKVAASLGRFLAQQTASQRLPGSLPPICNLTLHRNPYFTGRAKALETIRETLVSESTTIPIQVIAGLGGVGKTQITLEYIYRYLSDYGLIWWLPVSDFPSLVAEYAALATELDLPEKSVQSFPEMSRSVRRWLQKNGGWLLVFDDAQDWDQIQSLIPLGSVGHTIITSRNQVWPNMPRPMLMDRWERTESVEFFSKRIGKVDPQIAAELSEILGDLPLALEHAAAYMQSKDVSPSDYLDLFKNHQLELFGRIQPPGDYRKTILTTWNLSFQAVAQSSVKAAVILQFSAFLSSEAIPKTFFTAGPLEVGPIVPLLEFHDSVEILLRYSLIQVTETSISMHPLVQAVLREMLPEEQRKTLANACVPRLLTAFPEGDGRADWDECAALFPHVLAATKFAESMECDLEQVSTLLHKTGIYLHSRGMLTEARLLADRVVLLARKTFGNDHPNLASAVNNRGVLLKELGDFRGAEVDYKEALRILETHYGPNDPSVATLLNHHALILMEEGKYSDALAKCLRALQIDEAFLGPDHEEVARDLMTRGGILQHLGKLPESLQDHKKALEIYTKRFGEESTYTLTALSNLGRLQEEMGDLVVSRGNQEKALSIGEKLLGSGHPNVATYLSNLASVLEKLNEPKAAIPLYQRALAIEEVVFGPNHPTVAIVLANLAHTLRDLRDIRGAKARLERALAILVEFYGPEHPDVTVIERNLKSLQDV